MTSRERFNRAMSFQSVDRLPLLHMGVWQETLRRWESEGMTDYHEETRGYDGPMQSTWLYGCFQEPIPAFKETVINRTDSYVDVRNSIGQIERRLAGSTSMPSFLKYPIESREDWRRYKKRLNPDSAERYPDNWDSLVKERKTTAKGNIRGVAAWGFYGFPRQMLGPERLSFMFYDDPALIREMNDYWVQFTIKRLERAVREMAFDYALIWEDNCYNHGMLHSPEIFAEFMAPYYRTLIGFFRANDIDVISVDSDGNVLELIPLLLDVGVTALHPFEVTAGMDVIAIGKKYPKLQIWGGLDKRALTTDFKAIDDELERVVLPMKERGGYAAGIDHDIPPNVSLDNHRYFIDRLLELSTC